MRYGWIALAWGLLFPGPALAWGDLGHKIVCEIAFQELTPAAREEILRLIGLDPAFTTFSESCTWPDHPRKRPPEHFINVPRSFADFQSTACPVANKCLFTAIRSDLAVLKSGSAGDEEKLAALKFLGHWVGDIHQPLHVSFEDDRGGNSIAESAGPCSDSLHSVWDTCIIRQEIGDDPRAVATALEVEITDVNREEWIGVGPVGWADESLFITRSDDVGYCVPKGRSCWYSEDEETYTDGEERQVAVTRGYLAMHAPTIRWRLKQAGVRLAELLNSAFQ